MSKEEKWLRNSDPIQWKELLREHFGGNTNLIDLNINLAKNEEQLPSLDLYLQAISTREMKNQQADALFRLLTPTFLNAKLKKSHL